MPIQINYPEKYRVTEKAIMESGGRNKMDKLRAFFLRWMCLLAVSYAISADAAVHYVSTNGENISPYTNGWASAATQIQWAVNAATDAGDTVLVSNGVYDTGGKVTPSYQLTNRVCVTAVITLKSVNGPTYTSIKGSPSPNGGGLGTGAVRCVYLSGGASLIGFTLTNGYTMTNSTQIYYPFDLGGAGVLVNASGSVSNCLVVGNYAASQGGGMSLSAGGSVNNCIISNNHIVGSYGGGVYLSAGGQMNNSIIINNVSTGYGGGVLFDSGGGLKNCLIAGNYGVGGGVFFRGGGGMNNCTIVGNHSIQRFDGTDGGGIYILNALLASLTNCIIWGNTAITSSNIYLNNSTGIFSYVCSGPVQAGTGNTGSDPKFAGTNSGNYRLSGIHSPCVNAGINQSWMSIDLDGHSRIDRFSGIVDMGCYEYLPQGFMFSVP